MPSQRELVRRGPGGRSDHGGGGASGGPVSGAEVVGDADRPRVFISYSHDSPEHAERVLALSERLRREGAVTELDRYVRGDPEGGWPRWMVDRLEWAEFVLIVCTRKYYARFRGHEEEPGAGRGVDWEGRLITEAIYRSRSRTTRFVPVVFDQADRDWVPEALPLVNVRVVGLEEGFRELCDLIWRRSGVEPSTPGIGRVGGGTPKVGVPDLPPNHLRRPDEVREVVRKLVAGEGRDVSAPVGIYGMGGVGKTVLAVEVAHDAKVAEAFPDGVFWLTVGQEPRVVALQQQLAAALGSPRPSLTTEIEGRDHLRGVLAGRRLFLILDDVWQLRDAEKLCFSAPGVRTLVTTRDATLLTALGAVEHRVEVLHPAMSNALLATWAGVPESELPPDATDLARECGQLPLALALAGAMVRDGVSWSDALTAMRESDHDFFEREFPGYAYRSAMKALQAGVAVLERTDPAVAECYGLLAVIPSDVEMPESVVLGYWRRQKGVAEHAGRRQLALLERKALLRLSGKSPNRGVGLHDLQHDYLVASQRETLPSLHDALVATWGEPSHPPTPYAWRWLGWHLKQAGRQGEIRRLLFDFGWIRRKLEAADMGSLIADCRLAAEPEAVDLLGDALLLASPAAGADPTQLASQLAGRLLDAEGEEIRALIAAVRSWTGDSWLRPRSRSLHPPGSSLVRVFLGFGDRVTCVALGPDGSWAVAGSADGGLRTLDLGTGRVLREFPKQPDAVTAAVVHPDGRRWVTACADGTVRLWDVESGTALRDFSPASSSPANAVAVSSDGAWLLVGFDDRTAKLWRFQEGAEEHVFPDDGAVNVVAFTAVRGRAVTGSSAGWIGVWDVATGRREHRIKTGGGGVWALATHDSAEIAATAQEALAIDLWDLESGVAVGQCVGHLRFVQAVRFLPEGRALVSASGDQTLAVWEVPSGRLVRRLVGHGGSVESLAVVRRPGATSGPFRPGHEPVWVLSGSADRTVRLWDLSRNEAALRAADHGGPVNAVALTGDGAWLASASSDQTVRLWDARSGEPAETVSGHGGPVRTVGWSTAGDRLASGSDDRSIRCWWRRDASEALELRGHDGAVRSLCFCREDAWLVSGADDGRVLVWDLASGTVLRSLEGHASGVLSVAASRDGARVISGGWDETVRLWDGNTGGELRQLRGHEGRVSGVAIRADGELAVSTATDGTLRVWDLADGSCRARVEVASVLMRGLAVDFARGWAVVAAEDLRIRLVDLESGKVLASFTGESPLRSCALGSGGALVIGGEQSGRIHWLDWVRGENPVPGPTGQTVKGL